MRLRCFPLKCVTVPNPETRLVDVVKCPLFEIIPLAAVIPPAKVPSQFASSLHLTVHVAPFKVPTLMVPADCISVDT